MTAPVHDGDAPAGAPLHRLPPALPLALVLAGALCYANSLRGHFVYDDENFVQADDIPPRSRPLHWATIALNRWISTTDPLGYHLVNVTIHLLAGLALLGLVRRTVARVPGAVEPARQAWFAFACALLWVVHPLQTGAVTYLSQRTESLSALLALAALLAFVRSATAAGGRSPRAWAAAALAAFALSVATKEIALVLPVLRRSPSGAGSTRPSPSRRSSWERSSSRRSSSHRTRRPASRCGASRRSSTRARSPR